MKTERPLDGRTALVTGASRGIGLAAARALAGAGARVALMARSEAVIEAEAAALGVEALALPCDLSLATDVERASSRLIAAWGTPDIVVNNAGVFALGRIGEVPPSAFEGMFALNMFGPFRLLHAVVPGMKSRGSGHIVTIGSVADRLAYPENAAYAATKFGMRAVHEVLRAELRGSGVRATIVSPGPVDTSLWDAVQPETRAGFAARDQMLRPEDVADAVLFAVSRPQHANVDELRLSRA